MNIMFRNDWVKTEMIIFLLLLLLLFLLFLVVVVVFFCFFFFFFKLLLSFVSWSHVIKLKVSAIMRPRAPCWVRAVRRCSRSCPCCCCCPTPRPFRSREILERGSGRVRCPENWPRSWASTSRALRAPPGAPSAAPAALPSPSAAVPVCPALPGSLRPIDVFLLETIKHVHR